MKNLKYRIYSISSESKQYPASNLTTSINGWQTQRLCKYPQEITIQFFVPMKTKSLKLMFHQYKIPKLIEIFIKTTKIEKFRKLGYVRPSDNSQSGYQNKELKTIFFEFPCSFIKLILHENYKNQFNLFDQVGLEELSVQGQIVSASQLRNYDQTEIQTQEEQEMEQENQKNITSNIGQEKPRHNYQPMLYPQLFKSLQEQKRIAIQREDFQKASQVKNIIVTFQNLQRDILELQEQKKIAIEEEDFDKCHQLKKLILNKKEILEHQIQNIQKGLQPSNYYSRMTQSHNRSYIQQPNQDTSIKYQSPKKSFNDHENQILPALKKKMQDEAQANNQYPQTKQKTQQQSSLYQNSLLQVDHNYYKNFHAQSPQHQFSQQPNEQPNILEIEKLQPLQVSIRRKLEHHFPYIHEDNWKRALSKNWKSKNYALTELISMNINTKEQFLAVLQFISYIIQDSHTNIVLNTLTLLKNLIASQVQVTFTHLPYYVETIINSLISMLNDKPKIKQQAFLIYLNLADMAMIPLSLVVHSVIKHKSKVKLDPRHLCMKIELIKSLIEKYPQCCEHYNEILNWVAGLMQDPNSDVRNSASNLLIILSFQLGKDRVLYAIKNIPPNILTNFKQNLNLSLQGSKLQSSNMHEQDRERSMFYQESQRQSKVSNKKVSPSLLEARKIHQSPIGQRNLKESEDVDLAYSQQSLFKTEKSQQSYQWSNNRLKNQQQRGLKQQIKVMGNQGQECEYCFMENIMDINKHLTSQCSVLVYCQGCGGRIYLRQMTDHLLQMCDKINHQQCKRCGRAFEFDQINQHVALNNCVPLRKNKQRCQFCGQDIDPDDYSWVQHSVQCQQLPIGAPSLQEQSEQVSKQHY